MYLYVISHLTMMQEYELLRGMWIPVSQVRVLYPALNMGE